MKWIKHAWVANENGSILIAIIVTMVVVSVLGAGLLSIKGTAVLNQAESNSSSNAFHLAEAGYRYAQSNIETIENLHDQTFTLDNGNSFTITLKNYDFDITGSLGTQIQTQIPFGSVPFSDISESGKIFVDNNIHDYSAIDVTGDIVAETTFVTREVTSDPATTPKKFWRVVKVL